ncbi:MAG: glycoside hydrolase domain-containing protein [Actinomycetota bacterium]
MPIVTMLDRGQAPPADKGLRAIAAACVAAGTPAPGAWAFYLGGRGHNGGHGTTYTNELLDVLAARGVRLLPIYVGAQHSLSRDRGIADAKDAMRLNTEFLNRNDIIVADIEKHTSDSDPDAAVQYVNGWTVTLHDAHMRSMVYGSFNLAADLGARANPKPDAVWVARFRAHAPKPGFDPHKIPGVPADAFSRAGQRAWQYGAAFKDKPDALAETPCNIEGLNVDVSAIDAEIFGA